MPTADALDRFCQRSPSINQIDLIKSGEFGYTVSHTFEYTYFASCFKKKSITYFEIVLLDL